MSSFQTASTIGTAAAPFPWFDFNDVVAALPRLQKEDIRARLLDQLESALAYLLPRGKRRGAQFVVGNVQGDAGDSLVVDLDGAKRGLWLDFATGESGDALALWATVCGFILPQQFDALLEDIGHWLVMPRVAAPINGSLEHIGKVGLFDLDGEYCYASYLVRIVPDSSKALPRYLGCIMNSEVFRKGMVSLAVKSGGTNNINATKMKSIKVPVLSLADQKKFIAKIEALEKQIADAQEVIDGAAARKQAILQKYL